MPHSQKTDIQKLLQKQNEPFKYVAFSGGGAKGAIYSGVHEALATNGVLEGIEATAGSSAGAITAAMIASGISTADFKSISATTDFHQLLGSGTLINKDGKPLYQLLHDTISSNISKYLHNKDFKVLCNIRMESLNLAIQQLTTSHAPDDLEIQEELEMFKTKQTRLQQIIDNGYQEIDTLQQKIQQGNNISFRDLDLLHLIDPIKFKGLVVTATNRQNGELTIFDAHNTPDVEIALACRASASIPIVFQPVKINGIEYVDGGYRDNIPQTYFKKNNVEQNNAEVKEISNAKQMNQAKQSGRTLALAFGGDQNSDAHLAVYSMVKRLCNPNIITKFLVNVLFKSLAKVGGHFAYSQEEEKTYLKLRENALNAIILDTKDVSTLSFQAAREKAEYLHIKGSIQTNRHFANHDIGKNTNQHLDMQEFILNIYENTQNKGLINRGKELFIGDKQPKLKEILSFCKPTKWQDQEPKQVLADFICQAGTHRSNHKMIDSNTSTIKEIVHTLNSPTTSDKIKADFLSVLNVKSPSGLSQKNVPIKHHFTTKDFDHILSVKKLHALKPEIVRLGYQEKFKDIIQHHPTPEHHHQKAGKAHHGVHHNSHQKPHKPSSTHHR